MWYENCGMKVFVFVTCRISPFYFSHSTSALARVFCLATPRLETGISSPTLTPPAHGFFRQSPPRFLDCYCRPNTGAGPNNIPNTRSAVISPLVAARCTLRTTTAGGQCPKLRHYYCLSPQHDTYSSRHFDASLLPVSAPNGCEAPRVQYAI